MLDNYLFKPVGILKGVGEKLEEAFHRLGIYTIKDLLMHRPFGAEHKQHLDSLQSIDPSITYIIEAKVIKVPPYKNLPRNHKHRITIECEVLDKPLDVVFFNFVPYHILPKVKIGESYTFVGKITFFMNKMQLVHPDFYTSKELNIIRKVEAKYPLTYGINSKIISSLIDRCILHVEDELEWLPARFIRHFNFSSFKEALQKMHYQVPCSREDYDNAIRRLAMDELLAHTIMLKHSREVEQKAIKQPLHINNDNIKKLVASLKFTLTESQQKVLREIFHDLKSDKTMMRLVQGDVGSGKTIIAVISMLAAISEGGQSVIMAPTDILAQQHYYGISEMLEPFGLRVGMLKNAMPSKLKQENIQKCENGELDIIVGTHSLIQDNIKFHNLKLAVIDEQHRFGVKQRLMLAEKGQATDVLLMTATPIPRTLMLANYGDIDVSINDIKPEGRKPIDTKCVNFAKLEELKRSLQKFIDKGEKIYWICTLVEESENIDAISVNDRFLDLQKMYGSQVAMLHGQMKNQEKNEIMERFAFSSDINILVSTTVVEVGVNVPTATCIVIENAERFGLAQLHQLRGRVGRSHLESYCILLYSKQVSAVGMKRLNAMRDSQDGFCLAEQDLELRGGGEVLGTRQSGGLFFKYALFPNDKELLELANQEADHLIAIGVKELPEKTRFLLELFNYGSVQNLVNAG
ncbi:MAG: ATP-dependent DNA helicase RecG [Alphaproteobacteria bacterium]|nr:ATP-dependent DNA helicase RecG [Alphaproteobacteria bacterium]OJV12238.1 MAG: hypothetical protein BGO27_05830 [Alphaproteobacteria bacterium 33-17]